jgi:hypothetical protein
MKICFSFLELLHADEQTNKHGEGSIFATFSCDLTQKEKCNFSSPLIGIRGTKQYGGYKR